MSVSNNVYEELRRRLITGHYDPGSPLKEEHVAADLGVSRTPVRAAIQQLVSEGLLESGAKRGAIVKEWREEDAEEIFQLRILLEGRATALAARKMLRDDIARMQSYNETIAEAVETKKPGYLDAIHQANLAFHMAPYEACGSAHLRMFGASLLEYPLVIGGFYIYSEADMQESIRQHTEIVSAIRAGNEDWARSAVSCHLSAAVVRFRRSRSNEAQRKRDTVGPSRGGPVPLRATSPRSA